MDKVASPRLRTVLWRVAILAVLIFAMDQWLKAQILAGFRYESEIISITLAINQGVSFSMFASLGEVLKYIQIAILAGIALYLARDRAFFAAHYLPAGIVLSAGASNVLDRFLHGGVVDYVYWHYGFEFAIFNFADVMLNLAVVLFVAQVIFKRK